MSLVDFFSTISKKKKKSQLPICRMSVSIFHIKHTFVKKCLYKGCHVAMLCRSPCLQLYFLLCRRNSPGRLLPHAPALQHPIQTHNFHVLPVKRLQKRLENFTQSRNLHYLSNKMLIRICQFILVGPHFLWWPPCQFEFSEEGRRKYQSYQDLLCVQKI